MKKIKINFFVFILWMLFPINVFAIEILSDDFDDCILGCTVGNTAPDSANWMQWMTDSISATNDTVTHYSGEITSPGRGGSGKSLKLWRHSSSFVGSASYSGPLVLESPGSYNNFYMSFYTKIPVDLDMYGGVGLKMFRFNTSGGEIYLNILPSSYEDEWYRGNSTLSIEGGAGWKTILDEEQLLSIWDGNWHNWQFNFNLSTDSVTMWIDGNQVASISDTGMSGVWNSYLQHFPLGNQQANYWQNSWQAFEVDNLIIATTKAETDPEISPTIFNVSGTIANGQILTIEGNNLMNQTIGNFSVSNGSFEGSSVTSDGWAECVNGDCAYDTSVKLIGNKSFRSDISGTGGTNCPTDNVFGDSTYRSMSRYVRLYVRYSSSFNSFWPNLNYAKMVEYVSPTGVYVQPQRVEPGHSAPTKMLTAITGGTEVDMTLPKELVTDRWYCVEYYLATNGLTVWVDGVEIGTLEGAINFGAPWPQIGIVNACPIDGVGQMYIDGVMSNTSRVNPASIIELSGDGITWKYQEPVFLSDDSLQIKLDLSELSGTNYQLRVTNNRQETSVPYNLSGASDVNAPSAPSGLSVL